MSPAELVALNLLTLFGLTCASHLLQKAGQVLAETQATLKRAEAALADALAHQGKAREIVAELEVAK